MFVSVAVTMGCSSSKAAEGAAVPGISSKHGKQAQPGTPFDPRACASLQHSVMHAGLRYNMVRRSNVDLEDIFEV